MIIESQGVLFKLYQCNMTPYCKQHPSLMLI